MGDTQIFQMNDNTEPSSSDVPALCETYSVIIRGLCKGYHTDKIVLNGLNMNVKTGHIYAVLGASGCGKTTLLSCIVGLKRWDSGNVQVFGRKPGLALKNRIGYMPQDNALYQHLRILETCQLFGHLHNMPQKQVKEQFKFLKTLLDLPDGSKQIRNLSGGETRRVSLCMAMLNAVDLLILDEPDLIHYCERGNFSENQFSIWEYLTSHVKSTNTSIIITTHYTEEAQRSNTVGVIRRGRFIVESEPESLLQAYDSDTLQQAILQICHEDEKGKKHKEQCDEQKESKSMKAVCYSMSSNVAYLTTDKSADISEYDGVEGKYAHSAKTGTKSGMQNITEFGRRVYAHTSAMMLTFLRFPMFLAFILIFPSIQGTIVLITLGAQMSGMHLGVVNNEQASWKEVCFAGNHPGKACDPSAITCLFLDKLQTGDVFILDSYDSEASAMTRVHQGQSWGYLKIPANFSHYTMNRFATKAFAMNETIEGSILNFRLDQSQSIATYLMQKKIYESFLIFVQELAGWCKVDKISAALPLTYRTPVYGSNEDNFMLFIMPGELLCNLMFVTCMLSGLVFVTDWKQGTLSRARVAGLKVGDVLTSHFITQISLSIGQIIIRTVVLYFVFEVEIKGSLILYTVLCLMASVCGTMLGIFMGVVCLDEVKVLILGTFITVPFIFFGEVPFPAEFNAKYWQWFGLVIPTRLSAASLRSVIVRGLGWSHPLVWPGICVILIWIILLILVDSIMCKKLFTTT